MDRIATQLALSPAGARLIVENRIPVISDSSELNIPRRTLQTIISGKSLIDTFELQIESLDEAQKFLEAYGFEDATDIEKLRNTALEYIDEVLLADSTVRIPAAVSRLSFPQLLIAASSELWTVNAEWSCGILKVCHAVAHAQGTRDEDAYEAALAKYVRVCLPA